MSTVDIALELADLPHVPVTALEPFQGNLKELTAREYNKLKKSLQENGVIVPFFVWQETGKLLDGHQRQRVFMREGWHVDVPVVYISADDVQDAKRKLLVISSQYGKVTQDGWDEFTFDLDDDWLHDTVQFDALPFVFGDLGDDGEPAESSDAEPQVNRAEELRAEWGVETGQMWRLPSRTPGQEHRLICGDCTNAAVVARLEPPFDMMFTDPPYGVNYTGGHFHSGDVNIKREREKLAGDTTDLYGQFLPAVLPLIDGPCYIWFAASVGKPVYDAVLGNGGEIHALLIWHKVNATYAAMNAQYKQRHEPLLYFKRKGQTLRWCGATTESTIWEIPRDSVNDFHPTQKPIALAQKAIKNHDVMTVADFFCGSGSTIIAAENLSRQCRAVEISPAYVAVALQRYQDAFGITPELIDGTTD